MTVSTEIVSHELSEWGRRQGLMPRFLKGKNPPKGHRSGIQVFTSTSSRPFHSQNENPHTGTGLIWSLIRSDLQIVFKGEQF